MCAELNLKRGRLKRCAFLSPAAIGVGVCSLRRRARQRQQESTFYEPQTRHGGRYVVISGGGWREHSSEQGVDSGQL